MKPYFIDIAWQKKKKLRKKQQITKYWPFEKKINKADKDEQLWIKREQEKN